jgi:hypothetical protein
MASGRRCRIATDGTPTAKRPRRSHKLTPRRSAPRLHGLEMYSSLRIAMRPTPRVDPGLFLDRRQFVDRQPGAREVSRIVEAGQSSAKGLRPHSEKINSGKRKRP